ncbi:sigma-70 family RNA polymerase sigma factor [Neobacillus sp. OS1-2]|uniref:sigma-70 family RNA polymerase sigma factor n=1 Tax=Neobacillus sp. OS1-2 TaxID=3070680 RepID=UPI0027E0CCAB|nr:sigma-70 family RNA polymerase sigma factor [Neobacillus sp. OS1-2]WML39509.1 sigma-70 family RNA polymerase sigma factor [Neobacillus sp. OS1-2]
MESFEQLAEQYKPMINKIIHTLHIYKDQEELYQLGLIALWEASRRFDEGKGRLASYAYMYIKGYLLMELKKRRKDAERNLYPSEEFWSIIVDHSSLCPLEEETLRSYCSGLTPNQTKWVIYSALYCLSISEMAALEKVSVSAVKGWRAGAREKIEKVIMD